VNSIAVFVDVQNIYYTCRQSYGRQFNYRLLWQQLTTLGTIKHATAYAIEAVDDQQHKFQDALRHIGFEVKLKPYIQRRDGSSKADWDVGITIDVLTLASEVDQLVLLSGDGDFAMLLDAVRQRTTCRSLVYGVPALTAHALINSADEFRPILPELLR